MALCYACYKVDLTLAGVITWKKIYLQLAGICGITLAFCGINK